MNQIVVNGVLLVAIIMGAEAIAQVPDIPGCTDSGACNYDPYANIEDGSCEFEEHPLIPGQESTFGSPTLYWCGPLPDCSNITFGCGIPDGYVPADPDCFEAVLDLLPSCHDEWTSTCWALYAECLLGVPGCTDPYACNYDEFATFDNGDCLYPGYPCISADPCIVDAQINLDCDCVGEGGDEDGDGVCSGEDCDDNHPGLPLPDGSCSDMIAGCMEEDAANYRDNATFPTACLTGGPCGPTLQWTPEWSFGLIGWMGSMWEYSDPDGVAHDAVEMVITGPDEGLADTTWAALTVPGDLVMEFTFAFHTTDIAPQYDYPILQINGQTTGLMDYLIDTAPPGLPLTDASPWGHGQPVMPPDGWIPDPDLLPADNYLMMPLLIDGAESWDYPYQAPISLQLNAGDKLTIGVVSSDGLYGPGLLVVTAFAHELYCPGCTDPQACNFDDEATHDDLNCDYSCLGCMEDSACNYDPAATQPDSCDYGCYGCVDPVACNYDMEASIDDGSCDFCSCLTPPVVAATPSVPVISNRRGLSLLSSGGNLFDCPVFSTDLDILDGEWSPAVNMDGGGRHVLLLRADSVLFGTGENESGQIDIPEGLGPVTAFSAGGEHSLAIDANGVLHGWGDNSRGQLDLEDMADVSGIEAGSFHSLAWKPNGVIVLAVGDNSLGQCDVPDGLNVLKVASANHNVALTMDSTVVCWGSNAFGQCLAPEFSQPVIDVAASLHSSMALLKDGTLAVWGRLSLLVEPGSVFDIDGNPLDDFIAILDRDGEASYVSDDAYIAYQSPVPGVNAHSSPRCTEWCLDRDGDGVCDAADPCIGDGEEACGCDCLNDDNGNGLCDETEVRGCTDPRAPDYDPRATFDSGCASFSIVGCQSPIACNYEPNATSPGLCDFESCGGCTDQYACNFDPEAKWDVGNCEFTSCTGCHDPLACNYNPKVPGTAECDFCSCHFVAPFLDTYYSNHLVINSMGEATFGGSNFINVNSLDNAANSSSLAGTTWTNVIDGAVSLSGALLIHGDSSLQFSSPTSFDYYLEEVQELEFELESSLDDIDLNLELIAEVIAVPAGNDFVDVATGLASFMALRADGTAEVWGSLAARIGEFNGGIDRVTYGHEALNLEDWAESLQGVVKVECAHLWDFHALLDDGTWESYTSDPFILPPELESDIATIKCDFIQCMCQKTTGEVYSVNATTGDFFNGWDQGLPPDILNYGPIVDFDVDVLSAVLYQDGSVGVWLQPLNGISEEEAVVFPPDEFGGVTRVYGGMQLYLLGEDGIMRSYDIVDIFPDLEDIILGGNVGLEEAVTFSFPDSVMVMPPTECGQDCLDSDGDGVCDGADDCDGDKDALGVCGGECLLDADHDGICDLLDRPGCTYVEACTYLEEATWDDGSCVFSMIPPEAVFDALSNNCPSDLDGNGSVATADLLVLLTAFGEVCEDDTPPPFDPCFDEVPFDCGTPYSFRGHDYPTVLIDTVCWFQENLRSALFSNGQPLTVAESEDAWDAADGAVASPPEWDEALIDTYGLLYNVAAVTDPRGLCPWGWHIGTDADWMASEIHVGMAETEAVSTGSRGEDENIASRFKANSLLWSFSGGGSNLSGFTALPAGRVDHLSNNQSEGGSAWFWAPSGTSEGLAIRVLLSGNDGVFRDFDNANQGMSVRCVKD